MPYSAETHPYRFEATHYPQDEPADATGRLVALLAEVAAELEWRQISERPEPDPRYPEIGRYRELRSEVERLIDCAGYPSPVYRGQLIRVAALALDAALAHDGQEA